MREDYFPKQKCRHKNLTPVTVTDGKGLTLHLYRCECGSYMQSRPPNGWVPSKQ